MKKTRHNNVVDVKKCVLSKCQLELWWECTTGNYYYFLIEEELQKEYVNN